MPDEFIEYVHAPGVPTLKLTTRKMTEAEKLKEVGRESRPNLQNVSPPKSDRVGTLNISTSYCPVCGAYPGERHTLACDKKAREGRELR